MAEIQVFFQDSASYNAPTYTLPVREGLNNLFHTLNYDNENREVQNEFLRRLVFLLAEKVIKTETDWAEVLECADASGGELYMDFKFVP